MSVLQNSWIEKAKKKKTHETAPSYESSAYKDDFKTQTKKPEKRSTACLKMTMNRSLRGIRL